WVLVVAGDTCNIIVEKTPGLTLEQFLAWNTGAGSDCTTLWADSYACIGPHTTPVPTGGVSKPSPVQDGQPGDCNGWYLAKYGDDCNSIASIYKLSLSEFVALNPSVGSQCAGLRLNYYLCISRSCPPTPTPTTMKTSTIPTAPQVPAPTPTQAGISPNCNKWYFVVSGDTCAAIATANGIKLADFYSWNPSVGSTCGSLWLGYYVCVGVP
ncbi:unnamed protein product, partial [Tuber aestivum]